MTAINRGLDDAGFRAAAAMTPALVGEVPHDARWRGRIAELLADQPPGERTVMASSLPKCHYRENRDRHFRRARLRYRSFGRGPPGVPRTEVRELQGGNQRPDTRLSRKLAGYRLDRFISQGDLAAVYLARDERLDRQVALKVLAPERAGEAAFRTRLLHESRAAAAVGHPHILPVYGAGHADGTLYVAMRYVPGGDARSLLSRAGPLPLATVWSIISQAASALDAAHARGLIHGDVKPANMLLEAGRQAGGHLFLTDFGMGVDPSAGGRHTGSFDYIAPEQVDGRGLDGRTDLYSLACTGFELLCGTPLFEQDQPLTVMYAQLYAPPPSAKARRDDLPAAVDRVLAKALAKDPDDRYRSCAHFAGELFEALGLASRVSPWLPGQLADEPGQLADEPGQLADEPGLLLDESGRMVPESAVPGADPPRRVQGIKLGGGAAIVLAIAAVAIIAAIVGVAASNRAAPVVPTTSPAVPTPATSVSSSAASSPAPSPASSPALAPGQVAAAVNSLLNSSAATITALRAGVAEVLNCSNLPGAIGQIQEAVRQRGTEYSQASALPATALASGAAVKSGLIAAMRSSLDADKAYLTWAEQQLNLGCTPPGQSSAYGAAASAATAAGTAKDAFVQVWNPVAARYGIPQRSSDSI